MTLKKLLLPSFHLWKKIYKDGHQQFLPLYIHATLPSRDGDYFHMPPESVLAL